ncbi:MAG: allantoinase [Tepidisphaerales bacterium]
MSAVNRPKEPVRTFSFVYGMDMRPAHEVDAVTDAQLTLTDGTTEPITMHLIEGTREEIKAMLMQSVDAFFELHEETQG